MAMQTMRDKPMSASHQHPLALTSMELVRATLSVVPTALDAQ
jgi:hypothetical protein